MKKRIFSSKKEPHPMPFFFQAMLATGSGLLLTASFPDIGASGLAWIALIPLLAALRGLGFWEGFRCGFLAGMVHYLTLLYWLVPTMVRYGPLPLYMSVPLLVLLSAYLSLFPAVFAGTVTRLPLRSFSLLAGVPGLWVFLEYLRSTLFTGFPWEILGYSQVKWLHLIQISDILGVYGVSFLILSFNAVLFCLYLSRTRRLNSNPWFSGGVVIWAILLIGLSWIYGELRIRQLDVNVAHAKKVRIAVVQGNIEQTLKWDPRYQAASVQTYLNLTRMGQKQSPDLVVWPETATPFYFLHDAELSLTVLKGIRDFKCDFMIGSPAYEPKGGRIGYFNSAYLIDSKGSVLGRYDKAHLVPYGEYVPLKRWIPFLGKMVAHVGDFTAGEKGAVINWRGRPLGTLICYEIIFPYLSRAMAKNGAQVLINLINDAWYGDTSAPHQHFLMAVFRAVENRRSLVRSANTGISGFIDPVGRITAQTPLFQEAVLTREVPLMSGGTLYNRLGDWFPLACAGIAAATAGLRQKRNV